MDNKYYLPYTKEVVIKPSFTAAEPIGTWGEFKMEKNQDSGPRYLRCISKV